MKILKPTTKRRQFDPCIVHIVVIYAPIDMHTTKLAGMFIYSIGLSLFTAFRFAELEFSSWSFIVDCPTQLTLYDLDLSVVFHDKYQ